MQYLHSGSEEEKSDVKAAYEKCKGDMDKIVEHVPSEDVSLVMITSLQLCGLFVL